MSVTLVGGGFSAGETVRASALDGVEVGRAEAGEEFEEVTIEPGLGLIDVTVDVHAVQWGSLSRMIACVDAGLVDGGIAIDETTALVAQTGPLRSAGAGTVWLLARGDDGVTVRTLA